MRLNTHWFKPTAPKSAEQRASAMAFILWRTGRQMITRMRRAGYDIETGPMYLGVLREALLCLVQVADRIAYARLDEPQRTAFTSALVLRLADLLDENESHLLGPPPAGQAPWRERFIDQFNVLTAHYAEFGCDDTTGPDFGFRRYFGTRLEPLVPAPDRRWVLDQAMDIELPDAVALVQKGMAGVFSSRQAPRRASALGGDG